MWESVALIIAAILAAYAVCMSFYNTYRSETLDDREKERAQDARTFSRIMGRSPAGPCGLRI